MIWLILTIFVSAIFYWKAIRPLSYWKDRGVVHKKSLPIIGNSLDIILKKKSIFDHIMSMYQEFSNERYFGTHQFLAPTLIVNDLELIKRITVKDFEHFLDHNNIITEDMEPLFGKNLANLKGQRWRDMRATLSPSFTSSKMKIMFTLISECADEFLNYFEKQEKSLIEVEMKDILTRFTNDAIATVAFGYKCNSVEDKNNEFYVMAKRATNFSAVSFVAFFLYNVMPKLAQVLDIKVLPKSVTKFFTCVIKDNIVKRKEEGLVRPDMIHLLMEAQKASSVVEEADVPDEGFAVVKESKEIHSERKHKRKLTDEDIMAQAFIFIFGGFDSIATLMSFMAYELAVNEDVQIKLQEEIDDTLKKFNGKLTYEALHKMKYMDMVVSETLRKWPTGFFLDRLCVKDYLIEPVNAWEKPLLVEKGTLIQIPVVGIHRDPKYFSNPDSFDPERFNDENKHSIESFSFLPFGSGPRSCIASRFALMEAKTLIFYLLLKFDIVRTSKTPYPLELKPDPFSMAAKEGFLLGLKSRKVA